MRTAGTRPSRRARRPAPRDRRRRPARGQWQRGRRTPPEGAAGHAPAPWSTPASSTPTVWPGRGGGRPGRARGRRRRGWRRPRLAGLLPAAVGRRRPGGASRQPACRMPVPALVQQPDLVVIGAVPLPADRVAWVAATDAWRLTVVDGDPRAGAWPTSRTGWPAAASGWCSPAAAPGPSPTSACCASSRRRGTPSTGSPARASGPRSPRIYAIEPRRRRAGGALLRRVRPRATRSTTGRSRRTRSPAASACARPSPR